MLEHLPTASILAYSLETVVAEKIHAVIDLADQSSRMKDYYDPYQILNNQELDTEVLQEAIVRTFENRHTQYDPDTMFFRNDFGAKPIMETRWKAFMKKDNRQAKHSVLRHCRISARKTPALLEQTQSLMNTLHTYTFPKAKNIVICGDIHGEFNSLIYKLCIQYQLTDTLLIVAGDCGFGFEKPGYYEQVFNRNSSRLSKSNNWIVMMRGNHDDPSYFSEGKISHQRLRTISDYSVIQTCRHNILCVGVAVSIDRTYRIEHDSRHPNSSVASYWKDEMPIFDENALKDIEQRFRIDTVVTHTSPSFCELISKDGLSEWATRDPNLLADCDKERRTMNLIFEYLKANNHPLEHWFYGHFHQSCSSCIDGVLFSMLDIMEFKELR